MIVLFTDEILSVTERVCAVCPGVCAVTCVLGCACALRAFSVLKVE